MSLQSNENVASIIATLLVTSAAACLSGGGGGDDKDTAYDTGGYYGGGGGGWSDTGGGGGSGGSGGSGSTYNSVYGDYNLFIYEYGCWIYWDMRGTATDYLQWDVDLTLSSADGCNASDTSGSFSLSSNAAYFQGNYLGSLRYAYEYYDFYYFGWETSGYVTGVGGYTYGYYGYGYAN